MPPNRSGAGAERALWAKQRGETRDWSRVRPAGETARRNVGNAKERLRDYCVSREQGVRVSARLCEFPGSVAQRSPRSPTYFRAFFPLPRAGFFRCGANIEFVGVCPSACERRAGVKVMHRFVDNQRRKPPVLQEFSTCCGAGVCLIWAAFPLFAPRYGDYDDFYSSTTTMGGLKHALYL